MHVHKNICVLHLSATKDWGGGENHLFNLVTHDLPETNDQHFILCPKGSSIHKRLSGERINIHPALMLHKLSLNYVFKIIRLCKKHKINLIHIHDTTALTLAVMATKIADLPRFIFSKKTSYLIKERKGTLYKYNHPKIAKILERWHRGHTDVEAKLYACDHALVVLASICRRDTTDHH